MGNEHNVVINHEEQYTIWPTDSRPPAGWKAVGKKGNREACRAFIQEVWTDLRPLSTRERDAKMDEMERLIKSDSRR